MSGESLGRQAVENDGRALADGISDSAEDKIRVSWESDVQGQFVVVDSRNGPKSQLNVVGKGSRG